jgi:hypothetical protein
LNISHSSFSPPPPRRSLFKLFNEEKSIYTFAVALPSIRHHQRFLSAPPAPLDEKPQRLRRWASTVTGTAAAATQSHLLSLRSSTSSEDRIIAEFLRDNTTLTQHYVGRLQLPHKRGIHFSFSEKNEKSATANSSINDSQFRPSLPLINPNLPSASASLSRFNYDAWAQRLEGYADRQWILESIRSGVRIGYTGDRSGHIHPSNHPSAGRGEAAVAIEKEIWSEVAAGRMAGPFTEVPQSFTFSRTSPLAAVPKPDGDFRIIDDLSAGSAAINAGIGDDAASVHYADFDSALRMVIRLGRGCLLGKLDWKAAFRQIAVHFKDWPCLGLRWRTEIFFRLVLPFGLRSSPQLFCRFTKAFRWIMKQAGVEWIIGYLDDFLIGGGPLSEECLEAMRKIEKICKEIGVELHPKKRTGPSQLIIFLGIGIDTALMRTFLPEDKRIKLELLCINMRRRGDASLRELQEIVGVMVHAARVMQPGRLMTRHLIFHLSHYDQSRPRARRALSKNALMDLEWWISALPSWNGTGIIPESLGWESTLITTDACRTGGGAVGPKNQWFHQPWPSYVASGTMKEWPMPLLEMAAIVLALQTWGPFISGRRVRIHTDCLVIVYAWRRQRTKRSVGLLRLIRIAHALALNFRFHISMSHIRGVWNVAADVASRLSDLPPPKAESMRALGLWPERRVPPPGAESILPQSISVASNPHGN